MGEMYARSVLKISQPRVGLLSIGEEESKGNDLYARGVSIVEGAADQILSATWRGVIIFSGPAPSGRHCVRRIPVGGNVALEEPAKA